MDLYSYLKKIQGSVIDIKTVTKKICELIKGMEMWGKNPAEYQNEILDKLRLNISGLILGHTSYPAFEDKGIFYADIFDSLISKIKEKVLEFDLENVATNDSNELIMIYEQEAENLNNSDLILFNHRLSKSLEKMIIDYNLSHSYSKIIEDAFPVLENYPLLWDIEKIANSKFKDSVISLFTTLNDHISSYEKSDLDNKQLHTNKENTQMANSNLKLPNYLAKLNAFLEKCNYIYSIDSFSFYPNGNYLTECVIAEKYKIDFSKLVKNVINDLKINIVEISPQASSIFFNESLKLITEHTERALFYADAFGSHQDVEQHILDEWQYFINEFPEDNELQSIDSSEGGFIRFFRRENIKKSKDYVNNLKNEIMSLQNSYSIDPEQPNPKIDIVDNHIESNIDESFSKSEIGQVFANFYKWFENAGNIINALAEAVNSYIDIGSQGSLSKIIVLKLEFIDLVHGYYQLNNDEWFYDSDTDVFYGQGLKEIPEKLRENITALNFLPFNYIEYLVKDLAQNSLLYLAELEDLNTPNKSNFKVVRFASDNITKVIRMINDLLEYSEQAKGIIEIEGINKFPLVCNLADEDHTKLIKDLHQIRDIISEKYGFKIPRFEKPITITTTLNELDSNQTNEAKEVNEHISNVGKKDEIKQAHFVRSLNYLLSKFDITFAKTTIAKLAYYMASGNEANEKEHQPYLNAISSSNKSITPSSLKKMEKRIDLFYRELNISKK